MSSLAPWMTPDMAQKVPLPHILRRLAPPLGSLSFGPISLAVLMLYPVLDLEFQSAVGHFSIVTLAAGIAVCLALLILRAAVVRQDGRVHLIANAFLGVSSIFLIHAISTPTVLFTHTMHTTA